MFVYLFRRSKKQLKESFKNALSFYCSVFYQATLEDSQLSLLIVQTKLFVNKQPSRLQRYHYGAFVYVVADVIPPIYRLSDY
jgi:hypothetical protein